MKRLPFFISVLLLLVFAGCNEQNNNESPETSSDSLATDSLVAVQDSAGADSLHQLADSALARVGDSVIVDSPEVEKEPVVIHHGSDEQAKLDSIKAAKTKGKFK